MTTQATTTFLMSHLEPRYGIEAAAADLIENLSTRRPVRVVTLSGASQGMVGRAPVSAVGTAAAQGLRRFARLGALRGLGSGVDTLVLVGAWVAVPWLLANVAHRHPRRVIVWEHSFTRGRVAGDRRIGALWVLARVLYRAADLVVVPGPATADLLRDTVGAPVRVIPNLVGPAVTPSSSGSPRSGILVAGRLEPVKRIDLALRAFAALDTAESLTVLGDGVERSALEALADELGVGARVFFEGAVPRARVYEAMTSARVLLHTSEHETFGLVYLEAAAAELPVVSTCHPAACDVIPSAVPGNLADSTVASLVRALTDALTADTWPWADAQRVRASRFGPEATLTEWTAALEGTR